MNPPTTPSTPVAGAEAGGTPPSVLDTVERVAKVVSIVAVPVVLAAGGWWIQDALSRRSLNQQYVELAVSILSNPDLGPSEDLRGWAVMLLDSTSPVPLPASLSERLLEGSVKLPQPQGGFVAVSELAPDDPRVGFHSAVGLLSTRLNGGRAQCTAWLVSPTLIATAVFCTASASSGETQVVFGDDANVGTGRFMYSVQAEPVLADEALGVAVHRLDVAVADTLRILEMADAPPEVGTSLFSIYFPQGGAKSVTGSPCQVLEVEATSFVHDCDTAGGTSGAPLVSAASGRVVGMHLSRETGSTASRGRAARADVLRRLLADRLGPKAAQ